MGVALSKMIKINLLPRIINEKKAVRNTAILFGVLLVATIAAGMTYNSRLHAAVMDMEQQASAAEAWKQRVEAIKTETTNVQGQTKPIQQKVDFITAVLDYNGKYPKLFEEIAKWTYEKVQYTSMQSDGKVVRMQMRVKTLDDLGRYLLNMYRATDLFTSVTISSLPGYPRDGSAGAPSPSGMPMPGIPYAGPDMSDETGGGGPGASLAGIGAIRTGVQQAPDQASYFDITVDCTLKTPIDAPQFAGGAGGGAPGAPGGAPGMPGAMPGPSSMAPPPGPSGPSGAGAPIGPE